MLFAQEHHRTYNRKGTSGRTISWPCAAAATRSGKEGKRTLLLLRRWRIWRYRSAST